MNRKVLLILVDGMRSDSLAACGHPFASEFACDGYSNLDAQTVFPCITLPCHMSLFHSVIPQRHGILTNTYVPQVRPVLGLVDVLNQNRINSAFLYNWEELRDLSRPGSLAYSYLLAQNKYENTDWLLTKQAIQLIHESSPEFVFLYLGETDEVGHSQQWMSEAYLAAVHNAWHCIETIVKALPEDYTTIITADHGGHLFMHGTLESCDMTIPIMISKTARMYPTDKLLTAEITDIAPTITAILGVVAASEWTGKSLLY